MEAENLVLNHRSKREIVEELGEDLPHVSISIFAKAFIIKSISKKSHVRATRSKIHVARFFTILTLE